MWCNVWHDWFFWCMAGAFGWMGWDAVCEMRRRGRPTPRLVSVSIIMLSIVLLVLPTLVLKFVGVILLAIVSWRTFSLFKK
jgi:hypothetical protein